MRAAASAVDDDGERLSLVVTKRVVRLDRSLREVTCAFEIAIVSVQRAATNVTRGSRLDARGAQSVYRRTIDSAQQFGHHATLQNSCAREFFAERRRDRLERGALATRRNVWDVAERFSVASEKPGSETGESSDIRTADQRCGQPEHSTTWKQPAKPYVPCESLHEAHRHRLSQSRARVLHQPTELNTRGTNALAVATKEARVQLFLERLVGDNLFLRDRTHEPNAPARARTLNARQSIGWAIAEAQATADAVERFRMLNETLQS